MMAPEIIFSLVALIQGVGDDYPTRMATGQNFPSDDACSDAGVSMVDEIMLRSVATDIDHGFLITFDCVPFESIRR